jgi:predicted peroxiredoxin
MKKNFKQLVDSTVKMPIKKTNCIGSGWGLRYGSNIIHVIDCYDSGSSLLHWIEVSISNSAGNTINSISIGATQYSSSAYLPQSYSTEIVTDQNGASYLILVYQFCRNGTCISPTLVIINPNNLNIISTVNCVVIDSINVVAPGEFRACNTNFLYSNGGWNQVSSFSQTALPTPSVSLSHSLSSTRSDSASVTASRTTSPSDSSSSTPSLSSTPSNSASVTASRTTSPSESPSSTLSLSSTSSSSASVTASRTTSSSESPSPTPSLSSTPSNSASVTDSRIITHNQSSINPLFISIISVSIVVALLFVALLAYKKYQFYLKQKNKKIEEQRRQQIKQGDVELTIQNQQEENIRGSYYDSLTSSSEIISLASTITEGSSVISSRIAELMDTDAEKYSKIHRLLEEIKKSGVEVFLSYSWSEKNSTKDLVNQMERFLVSQGIKVYRDQSSLKAKNSGLGLGKNIYEFMSQAGANGVAAIIFINDDYLRSINCLYEANNAMKGSKNLNYDNIFPVIYKDPDQKIKIFDLKDKIEYLNYWQNKLSEAEKNVKKLEKRQKKIARQGRSIINIDIARSEVERIETCANTIGPFLQLITGQISTITNNFDAENIEGLLEVIAEYCKTARQNLNTKNLLTKPDSSPRFAYHEHNASFFKSSSLS